jgi:hypothetical protein
MGVGGKKRTMRALTPTQLDTIVACYFGELSIAVDSRHRKYLKIYHNNVDITGRMRSVCKRRLVRGNFLDHQLIGYIVTPAGLEAIAEHPEVNNG